MKIVVGLGNPGEKYKTTRHNVAWLGIDALMDFWTNPLVPGSGKWVNEPKFKSLISDTTIKNQKVLFVYPQTYMNESGTTVQNICDYYKDRINISEDLLVIHDDTDIPLGTIKVTNSSSSAGHNGAQDIIDKLGTQDFHRIRIGVESRSSRGQIPTEAFVLQNFSDEELKKLRDEVLPKVNQEIKKFLKLEIEN